MTCSADLVRQLKCASEQTFLRTGHCIPQSLGAPYLLVEMGGTQATEIVGRRYQHSMQFGAVAFTQLH